MQRATFLLAALLLFLSVNLCFAFDIAIYKDPLSYWNERYLCQRRNGTYTGSQDDYLGLYYSTAQMESVYTWYQEMGATKVMVAYLDNNDYDWIKDDSTSIRLMNWYYPGEGTMHGEKYVDAQYRDVQVGYDREALPWNDQRGYWSYRDAIGDSATRTMYDPDPQSPTVPELPCVGMSGTADTLWRATSYLGNFSGWDYYTTGWLDSSIYMPMHYRLTWAVDPNGSITTSTPLADFYWIVKIPDSRLSEFSANSCWWRFPVKTLTLEDVADTNNWNQSYFNEDAHSGTYTLLNAQFDSINTVPWDEIYLGPAHHPRSLDEVIPWDSVSYGLGTEVRMAVNYRGTHSFYLNRIEVYDEGTWRMFASPDSTAYADSIAAAFQSEYSYAISRSAGWYYDEWDLSGGRTAPRCCARS